MKNVKWQNCVVSGMQGATHDSAKETLLGNNKVTLGIRVCAHYKNLDVYLQIKSQIQENVFVATVLFFDPANSDKPDDLDEGDEVNIDRQHICWLSGD